MSFHSKTALLWRFIVAGDNEMYSGFLVTVCGKDTNIKFHENPSSGRHAVTFRQKDGQAGRQTDRQMDTKKVIVAFRDCVNAPKIVPRMSKIVLKSNVIWNLQRTL